MQPGTVKLLKIYTGENEQWQNAALYHALVLKCRQLGLAGVTVYRGMEGYGPEKRLRTSRILDLSVDLPVIVEVVDSQEKIDELLPHVRQMVKKGLVTLQDVQVLNSAP
jgi:PII-like signaling protein